MSPSRSAAAVSFVEILVCGAIIGLLAALLVPVLLRAKDQGFKTRCFSNMRQLGIASLVYRDTEGEFPNSFDIGAKLAKSGGFDSRLLLCDKDPSTGVASIYWRCMGRPEPVSTSYFVPFDNNQFLWNTISSADPNPGILACRTHGTRTPRYSGEPLSCNNLSFYWESPIHRLRVDGSVRAVPFSLKLTRPRPGRLFSFRLYRLFTDEKTPLDDIGS